MFGFLALVSAVCATAPMLAFLWLAWFLDRHDREPWWLFGLTFLWGALGAVLFALIGSGVMLGMLGAAIGPEAADAWSAVLIAPLVEEPTKALVLFLVMFSRHFDNATDGFVYGSAAGLGFGMTENFLYFLSVAATGDVAGWVQTVIIRTLFSAVMHAAATSCVGAMLGFARFRGLGWKVLALPIGFGAAIGIHATWNGLLTLDMFTGGTGALAALDFLLFPIEGLVLFGVFQLALWDERATLRRELAEEAQAGLLPLAHARAIATYFGRSSGGWLEPGIPRHPYIRAVTTLALRKHQARNASARGHAFYAQAVDRLRLEIRDLRKLAR
jgi:RsiW-degrading membrane proteinase PrsW (M82 family)